jgi:hypothetical protein
MTTVLGDNAPKQCGRDQMCYFDGVIPKSCVTSGAHRQSDIIKAGEIKQ